MVSNKSPNVILQNIKKVKIKLTMLGCLLDLKEILWINVYSSMSVEVNPLSLFCMLMISGCQ